MKIIFKTLIGLLLVQVSYVTSWDHLRHASPGQFPHQAVLVWIGELPFPPFHLCGGAILNEFWILSSAYCVVDILHLNNVRIKVGSHNISLDDEHVRNVEVEKIIVHTKYTRYAVLRNHAFYDVGLLKLKHALVFNHRVSPIKLPKADGIMSGRTKLNYNLVMTGWGQVGRGILPETSDILCTVNEPKVPIRTCQESIRQAFNWVELNDLQICTRPLDGSDLACMGDFGGPLIQYDSNNKPEIIGIRTWTMIACNTNGVPPIYARIPSFVKWINKNINQN